MPGGIPQIMSLIEESLVKTHHVHRKIKDLDAVIAGLSEMRALFEARWADLERHFGMPYAASVQNGSESPLPVGSASYWLHTLYQRLWLLHDKVQTYHLFARVLTSNAVKRRKVQQLYETSRTALDQVLLQLSLVLSEESRRGVQRTNANMVKLAVATGADDFEDMTPDDGQKLYMQGEKYLLGYGVPQQLDVAFRRFKSAAKRGVPEAMNQLGRMYELGIGHRRDMITAHDWYKQAAQRGSPDALANLGRLHLNGIGMPANALVASDLYLQAARKGHVDAMVELGGILEKGQARAAQVDLALGWYRAATERSSPAGMNALGACYYRGIGVGVDYGEAARLFHAAAEHGLASAQNNLGICYEEGLGLAKDLLLAKTYYARAAEQRHASGMANLGYLYLLEADVFQAVQWFTLALQQNHAEAAFLLGTIYQRGAKGHTGAIARDPVMACQYLLRAAKQGHTGAHAALRALIRDPSHARAVAHLIPDGTIRPDTHPPSARPSKPIQRHRIKP